MNEGVHQWCQRVEKHLWGEQVNLSTRKTVNGPVLCLPSIMHILTIVGLQYPFFVVLSPVWGAKCYLGILSSISDSCQSSVKKWMSSNEVDLPKDRVPDLAAGTSTVCSYAPWDSKQGRSQTPMEWSQVTGMKQSWICCSAVS